LAQMMEQQPESMGAAAPQSTQTSPQKAPGDSADTMASPDAAQQKAAKTFAAKAAPPRKPTPTAKPVVLTPLTPRERIVQLLDRFTYGPRPGEVDRVLAQGEDAWLAQQFNPEALPDAQLAKRLADYPTLAMTPDQVVKVFPDRGQVNAVDQGKVPYPSDPLQNGVMEVQIYKLHQEEAERKVEAAAIASHMPPPEPTDAEKAAQHKQNQATALRIAGQLLARPKGQRMTALIAMPAEDRAVFTADGNLTGDQRTQLLADFNPREREAFQGMSGNLASSYRGVDELAQARMLRDILSERQLQAVMTAFWFNHFNVYYPKDSDQWYTRWGPSRSCCWPRPSRRR